MPYEVKLTIYIIAAILVFGALFFWLLFPPIRRKLYRNSYKRLYYNDVNRVVRNNDFYLINGLSFDVGESQTLTIDHLVGGDKYLYVIIDYYVEGTLKIDPRKPTSFLYVKGDTKLEIANPIQVVRHSMNKLSSISGIADDFLIGIVLINNDCNALPFENPDSAVNIVRLKDASRFIENCEKAPVKPFRAKQLWQAIQDLHAIKENVKARKEQK